MFFKLSKITGLIFIVCLLMLTQGSAFGEDVSVAGDCAVSGDRLVIERRQYARFRADELKNPITIECLNGKNCTLSDISRGGVAVLHENSLTQGEIIPVHIHYSNIDIYSNIEVVSCSETRAGAKFAETDNTPSNRLLILDILLEADKEMFVTS